MFIKLYRYIKSCYQIGSKGRKLKPGEAELLWLKAHFSDPSHFKFMENVVLELHAMTKALNITRNLTAWEKLWRCNQKDLKLFFGVDLEISPTRSVLCILLHYGDISEDTLVHHWEWAVLRDVKALEQRRMLSPYPQYVRAMRETIILTNQWVNKRKEQCNQ